MRVHLQRRDGKMMGGMQKTERDAAPVWRDAWREFQDPYLGPDAEKFPSPFESFVAGFMAARAKSAPVQVSREDIVQVLRDSFSEMDESPFTVADEILALFTRETGN